MASLGTSAAVDEEEDDAAGAACPDAGGLVFDIDVVGFYYAAGIGASGFLGGAFTYLML